MNGTLPICRFCKRLVSIDEYGYSGNCEAFPKGIPQAIFQGCVDHRTPVQGDLDKQFLKGDIDENEELFLADTLDALDELAKTDEPRVFLDPLKNMMASVEIKLSDGVQHLSTQDEEDLPVSVA